MTQMFSLLSADEVLALRGYLERCVEGLEHESRREQIPAADELTADDELEADL
jgi:hypothetical protein